MLKTLFENLEILYYECEIFMEFESALVYLFKEERFKKQNVLSFEVKLTPYYGLSKHPRCKDVLISGAFSFSVQKEVKNF